MSTSFSGFYGSELTVKCNSTGTPTPKVHWIVADQPTRVVSTSALLHFEFLNESDAGSYQCVATNQYNTEVSEPVVVDVVGRPSSEESIAFDLNASTLAGMLASNESALDLLSSSIQRDIAAQLGVGLSRIGVDSLSASGAAVITLLDDQLGPQAYENTFNSLRDLVTNGELLISFAGTVLSVVDGSIELSKCFVPCATIPSSPWDNTLGNPCIAADLSLGGIYSCPDHYVLQDPTSQLCDLSHSLSGFAMAAFYCRRNNDPPMVRLELGDAFYENQNETVIVGTLLLSDTDTASNLTAEIVGGDSNILGLVSSNGTMALNITGPLNFESIPQGSVCVDIEVRDDGSPQMDHTTELCIAIGDVNEPFNITLPANISLEENSERGEVVTSLTIDDEDFNSSHTLRITPGPGWQICYCSLLFSIILESPPCCLVLGSATSQLLIELFFPRVCDDVYHTTTDKQCHGGPD